MHLEFLYSSGEKQQSGLVVLNLRKRSLKIKWMVIIRWYIVLTLNDLVVHDHTSVRYLPHLRLQPGESRVPNNGKTLLEHA
jgi:hypothetical protein